MNLEEYGNPIVQKYKFIVAVAVLKSRPPNLSVLEYIEKLRNAIEKDTAQNTDGTVDFEINNDLNMEEKNITNNQLEDREAAEGTTLIESIDLADEIGDSAERVDSPSILERYTEKNNNDEQAINPESNDREGDDKDSDTTLFIDSPNCDETQIYTIPDDMEIIPYENLQNTNQLDGFFRDYTNIYDDASAGVDEIVNFEKFLKVRDSENATAEKHVTCKIKNRIIIKNDVRKLAFGTQLSKSNSRIDSQKTECSTQPSQNNVRVDSQKTMCETPLSQNSITVDSQKTICQTPLSQNSITVDSEKMVCEIPLSQGNLIVDCQKDICEIQQSQNSIRIDSQKTICETQPSQNITKVDGKKTICEAQLSQNSIRVDSRNTICDTPLSQNSITVDREEMACEIVFSQSNLLLDSQKTISETQQSQNSIRIDSQKTISETQPSQNITKVDGTKTICETQLSQNSIRADSQNTIYQTQLSQNTIRVKSQKTVCASQMKENNEGTCVHEKVFATSLSQSNTRAIKKQPRMTKKNRNSIDSTCNQKFSDNVIEDSQNTNDKSIMAKPVKRKNLKRPLDKTPKSSNKAVVEPLKNEIDASSKEKSCKNIHCVQQEIDIGRAVSESRKNDTAKLKIIEDITIRKATPERQVEIFAERTDGQTQVSSESVYVSEKQESVPHDVAIFQNEKTKYGSDNPEISKDQDERLEEYSRIIMETEPDRRISNRQIDIDHSEIVVDLPSVHVHFDNGNDSSADVGAGNIISHEEDPEDSGRCVRRLTLTIFELMHKARCYVKRDESKKAIGFSGDSGYTSDRRSGLGLSDATVDDIGMALYRYLVESSYDVECHTICSRVSEVLGELVDRLNAEDTRPRFLVEILEKTNHLIEEIFDGTKDSDQARKEGNVCTFLFLNTSLTILTHTLEKIVPRLEKLHDNLIDDSESYEINNLEELENQCHLFHILEILLKRYLEVKDKEGSREPSCTDSSSSVKSSIIDVWKNRWCPDGNARSNILARPQERTCCIKKYRDVLARLVQHGVRSYSLVSFAALQCYNLLHS